MKKLFTLFTSMIIALSAMAAPVWVAHSPFEPATKNVKALRKAERKIAPVYKAQADAQTYTIEANNLYVDASYNAAMLEWFDYGWVEISGGNDEWTIEGALYPADENYYTTYSTENDDIELYAYGVDDNAVELSVSAAELKKTSKGNQFVATAVDEDGNTFKINLTFYAPDQPKGTVDINFTKEETYFVYIPEDGGYYISGSSKDYIGQLFVFTDNIEGTYTIDDCDPIYSNVYKVLGTSAGDTVFTGMPFTIQAEIKLVDGMYDIKADILAADSTLYRVNWLYEKPTAKQTVKLEEDDVPLTDYTEDEGMFAISAGPEDESYVLYLAVQSDQIPGTYTLKDMLYENSFVLIDNDYIDIFEAAFTVTDNGDGTYTFEGYVLCSNNVKYEFVLKTAPLTAVDQVTNKVNAAKRIANGQIIIETPAARFNLLGTKLQ